MQSKLRLMSAMSIFVFCATFLSAGAQSLSVYPVPYYAVNPGVLNYMMGTVSLSGIQNIGGIPTNTVPVNGTTSSTVCSDYLTTFHKYGSSGADVAKLQIFLNQYNGANLNGKGFYGPATVKEVRNLQYAYGITPSGMQLEKTTALINSLKCGNIAKKSRVVYVGGSLNYGTVSVVSANKKVASMEIYPNPITNTPTENTGNVKKYDSKANTLNESLMKKMQNSTATMTATDTSTASGIEDDFQKIKDNYKAYVLVFVLVLALFWFLRKAATE